MPRKPCYWTRKLELDLVAFVRDRDFIWRQYGNTNHHIQQKYKAYAEFAAKLGRGFTARSVRDRWVNIRSTFNHNLRRVDKSKEMARAQSDVYVPCWPLWKPLQFLREVPKKDDINVEGYHQPPDYNESNAIEVKLEDPVDNDTMELLKIRQRGQRTDRPRKKSSTLKENNRCTEVVEDLVKAMKPLNYERVEKAEPYWFFGKHVTDRLNSMRKEDADRAGAEIMQLLENWPKSKESLFKFYHCLSP